MRQGPIQRGSVGDGDRREPADDQGAKRHRHGQIDRSAMDATSARRVETACFPVPILCQCSHGRSQRSPLQHWTRLFRPLGWFQARVPTSPPRCAPTLLCGGRVPAPGPYLLTVAEEDVGKRQHGECYKGDEARGPLVAKRLVHLEAKERKYSWTWTSQQHGLDPADQNQGDLGSQGYEPANEHLTRALAARALAAYRGYAST